jgi:hypothetical protein
MTSLLVRRFVNMLEDELEMSDDLLSGWSVTLERAHDPVDVRIRMQADWFDDAGIDWHKVLMISHLEVENAGHLPSLVRHIVNNLRMTILHQKSEQNKQKMRVVR